MRRFTTSQRSGASGEVAAHDEVHVRDLRHNVPRALGSLTNVSCQFWELLLMAAGARV